MRVRIAPSPTGDPHVGTAYIALFNYVFARQQGGAFILRIEDTDQTRSRADSERQILTALAWLGISWDEGPDVGGPHGPYHQSKRLDIYARHTRTLVERGRAYPCFCTPERLAELRKAQMADKVALGYDRRCRAIDPAEAARRVVAGEPHTIRLAVPTEGTIRFTDRLRGPVEIAATQVDDQVLLKSDGFPTYHLANVVDDRLMEITHVIRAEEWISSTPKHVLLYEAFDWPQPEWIHMPLLRNQDKSKISKRKNPVSINFYRDAGILPQAMLNFLAIMGWSFGGDREKFTVQEMIEVFSWDKMSLGGPVFNLEKLRWLNERYIHELDYGQLADQLLGWRMGKDYLTRLVPLVRERIKQLADFVPATDFFFSLDVEVPLAEIAAAVPESNGKALGKLLLEYVEGLDQVPEFTAAHLEPMSRSFGEAKGLKSKALFMVLRLCVTGRKASPPLFETMEVLGKEICRHRLRRAAELVAQK
ncbi:MAG TPA: glutamate--tRNA ligase [Kofleriaceae bacterium]|nr:glutamate--tRNA ligase [Kofleriaceae bacterium]